MCGRSERGFDMRWDGMGWDEIGGHPEIEGT